MLCGIALLLGWMLVGPRDVLHEVFPALAVSCIVYLLFARLKPAVLERLP
jgi:hypothetical protein